MNAKPLILRTLASRDVDEAVDYYSHEAGEAVALDFVAELENIYDSIARNPGIGSPRFAHELDISGLRTRMPRRYPYLVFYIERADCIDVWRVLHTARDIAAWMAESPDD